MDQIKSIQDKIWKGLKKPVIDIDCTNLFMDNGKLSSLERLNIYRNTVCTAHIDAISQCYKCCEKILGQRYFNQLARQFYYLYPARSQDLNEYGSEFPTFLQTSISEHTELKDFEYLADLAKLELAIERAYYAKDDPIFCFEQNLSLNSEAQHQLYLILSHSISLIRSKFPIYEIWHENKINDDCHEVTDISNEQFICVVRENYEPSVYKIEKPHWWLLDKFSENYSLSEIAELIVRDDFEIQIQKIIPELIQRKWICGLEIKKNHN